jgi:hypothetical protein
MRLLDIGGSAGSVVAASNSGDPANFVMCCELCQLVFVPKVK